jgi:high-affinity iron transporter
MLAASLLTFREGLEAALIVSIILSYLRQIGHRQRRTWVWAAVGVAVLLSLGLALGLQAVGATFEGKAEYIFEGFTMLFAVAILTWMIFWMRYQARYVKSALEEDVRVAVDTGQNWGLFGVAFLAVFREGIETALFLTASSYTSDGTSTLIGGALGLTAAVIFGLLIHTGMARLDVSAFFNVTSILLLVFAAGLFAHGIHEFQEAGWFPVYVEHVWDLKPVLDDKSLTGSLLRTLVGYNDNPSLIESISYIVYWGIVLTTVRWWVESVANRNSVQRAVSPSGD